MKVLFRIFRFLVSYLVSGFALYLSGYGNLMEKVHPDVAMVTFLLSDLVMSIILMLIWEIYLSFKNKIKELEKQIEQVENIKTQKNEVD